MLTELVVRNLKPKARKYRRSDKLGLYLQVNPSGSKCWRYKFRLYPGGRMTEKVLALGIYIDLRYEGIDQSFYTRGYLMALVIGL